MIEAAQPENFQLDKNYSEYIFSYLPRQIHRTYIVVLLFISLIVLARFASFLPGPAVLRRVDGHLRYCRIKSE